jgi:RHS repeat-associated protein
MKTRVAPLLLGISAVVSCLAQTPPFTQCPPVGANTSCAVLLVINADTTASVRVDPSQGPFDRIEDTLVGVQNNSSQTIFSLSLSSPIGIFDFDGDGICSSFTVPRPAGCPFGPTGYEGPGVIFSNINTTRTAGIVNFNPGIAPGRSAFFGLEESPSTAQISPGAAAASGPSFLGPAGSSINPTGFFAEPVNTATGNYYTSHVDLRVNGRGLIFNLTRNYNSRDGYTGPLGFGWTHSYNTFLVENTATGIVTIKLGTGANISFTPAGAGTYDALTTGVFDTLQKHTDRSFTLTRKTQTKLNFSAAGKLLNIIDRSGNSQVLNYDARGNLVFVTASVGRIFRFSYDTTNRLIAINDPSGRTVRYSYDALGNLITYTDPIGGVTQYTYDNNHRMLSATDARGIVYLQNVYDSQGRVVIQRNARGTQTRFAYDTPVIRSTSITDARDNVSRHIYDRDLRLVQVADAQGGLTTVTYNANNNRTTLTDANGNTTAFSYDAAGNVISARNPLGHSIALTYDSRNNVLTATNPAGSTSTFSYDATGNLTGARDALGNTTTFTYDRFGQLTAVRNAVGNATGFSYDSLGNVARVSDPLGNDTRLGHDALSRLTSVTDAAGHVVSTDYDNLNRPTDNTNALGSRTRYEYDGVGNLVALIDANNNVTRYQYDGVNNLVTVIDPLGHTIGYGYDATNNLITFSNQNRNITSYGYDSLNRRTRATDPLGLSELYSYDSVGNLASMTDGNGHRHRFAYDALNRRTTSFYADGNTIAYSYDVNGNRTLMVDSHGSTAYAYDSLDRISTITYPGGRVVGYGYDALGRRTSLRYPSGQTVFDQYDAANRLIAVTDWRGGVTHYAYDSVGRLTATSHPNGAESSYTYDAANRLVGVVNRSRDKTFFLTYVLDNVGNRLQMMSESGGPTMYEYDGLYRLISWSAPSGETQEYSYDAVGNRLAMVSAGVTVQYGYDEADRLIRAGDVTFEYDGNGNQIRATTLGGIVNYGFDALNRLVSLRGPNLNVQYSYDGDGNRIMQQVGRSVFRYVNDTARALSVVLTEEGSDGDATFVYGLSLVSNNNGPFRYFYQFDALGSVTNITNHAGALNGNYAYDAWGAAIDPEPPKVDAVHDKNKFKFIGDALDPGTGLYYLRSRYYDPTLGRFLSKDEFPGIPSRPATLHRYAYAGNNPATFTDKNGNLFGVDDAFALVGGLVTGLAGQYVSDVVDNLAAGETGFSVFVPHSSVGDYLISGIGGAVTGELTLLGTESLIPGGAFLGRAAGSAVTEVAKDWFDHKDVDVGKILIDVAVNEGTDRVLGMFPKVPGRLPKFPSSSFFFGAHAQREILEGAIEVGVEFDKEAIGAIVKLINASSPLPSVPSGLLK